MNYKYVVIAFMILLPYGVCIIRLIRTIRTNLKHEQLQQLEHEKQRQLEKRQQLQKQKQQLSIQLEQLQRQKQQKQQEHEQHELEQKQQEHELEQHEQQVRSKSASAPEKPKVEHAPMIKSKSASISDTEAESKRADMMVAELDYYFNSSPESKQKYDEALDAYQKAVSAALGPPALSALNADK